MTSRLTPAERSLRASAAANARWAKKDRTQASQEATSRILARFEREVDPELVLDPAERERRAENARRAYFQLLALKSSRARRARREAA